MAKNLKLRDLKKKTPQELLVYAEELGVENASSMRTQDMLFEILKTLASDNKDIDGEGVLEVLQDGFGFLRSMEANYLPGPDDIYVSPSQIKRFGLRSGDTVELGSSGIQSWYSKTSSIEDKPDIKESLEIKQEESSLRIIILIISIITVCLVVLYLFRNKILNKS